MFCNLNGGILRNRPPMAPRPQRFASMKFHSVVLPNFGISLNIPPTRKHDEIFDVDSRRSNTYRICTGEGDSLEL